jgi:GDSL-like Lipase/Acylhydrolase family
MIKAFLINLAVLIVLLFCFEIVLRATGIGFDSAAFEPDAVLHHVHKKNYSFINDNPTAKEFSDISIRYDDDGRICNPSPDIVNTTSPKLKVALLGDSFTEAAQVHFTKSFAGLLQERFADTVLLHNYGVGDYSPVFYYLQSKNNLQNKKYDYAIMLLYSNDVRDDSAYFSISKKNNAGDVVAIDGGKKNVRAALARKSYLMRLIRKYYIRLVYWYGHKNDASQKTVGGFVEEQPVLSPLTKELILKTDSVLKQSGTQLILSAVPSKYKLFNQLPHDSSDFANQVKSFALQTNISYIDLVPAFENESQATALFFANDIHFNVNGHKVVAEELEKVILQKVIGISH